jgi:uncharacterized protein
VKLALALAVLAACGSSPPPSAPVPVKPAAPAITAVDPAASLETTSEEVTFGNNVPGTLVRPTSGGPYAGVVLMAGSGPTDRDWTSPLLPAKNGSGKLLAEALAKHGVVVLRFDKAGVGGNKADLTTATFDVYRDEGQAALAALRARKDVGAVFVAGHSEGGIHATRVALAEGDHIAGLLLLSASSRAMTDLMLAQLEPQLRAALPQRADAELAAVRTAFADFKAGKPVDPTKVTAIPGVQQLVGAVVNPATATLARGLVTFEPLPAVAQVHVPIFVFNGMKDMQVDPELDAKKLAAANKGATLFLAPEADHVLKHETKTVAELRADMMAVQTGYNAEGRSLDEASVNAIVGWLADRTKR